jgi:hypothetical protein
MSAINFCGVGFRRGLLLLAKDIFRKAKVQFVVIAGGLIDAKQIYEDVRVIKRRIAVLKNEIKERKQTIVKREKLIASALRRRDLLKSEKEAPPSGSTISSALEKIRKQIDNYGRRIKETQSHILRLNELIKKESEKLEDFSPKVIAKNLAKALPMFVDPDNKKINCIIVPSPVLDRELGSEVANLLQGMRDDVRVYHANSGADRMPLYGIGKTIEILTPRLRTFRSSAMSRPVQKIIAERESETSRERPDVYFVGGCGVAFWTPKGYLPVPIVAIPSCHKPEGVPLGGGQIGVMVATLKKQQSAVDVELFPLKDMVSIERSYVEPPTDATDLQQRLVGLIGREGKLTTSKLAELTLSQKQQVTDALAPYMKQGQKIGKAQKHFPGLWYEEASHRWDFHLPSMQMHLCYPTPKSVKTIRRVEYCCPHFGSKNTNYLFFRKRAPEIILAKRATHFVCTGDFIEGLKHDLLLQRELIGVANVIQQEAIAARELSFVTITVFKARFHEALQKLRDAKVEITPTVLRNIVAESMITHQFISGNHDEWIVSSGGTPLQYMKTKLITLIGLGLAPIIRDAGLCLDFAEMYELINSHIVHVLDDYGYSELPEGVMVSLQHPHKGSAQAISQRAEEALAFAPEALFVEEGNFHKGGIFFTWSARLGTRFAVQLPTLKHGSRFENKVLLRHVDHGINSLEIDIDVVTGKITRVQSESFSGDAKMLKTLEHKQCVRELLEYIDEF